MKTTSCSSLYVTQLPENSAEADLLGAANRFPDKCDSDPEGTRALNIAASGALARLCAAQSVFLIYISTDYVFPGTEGDAPYEAHSSPKPPNLYGETKWEGEKAVLAEYEKAGKAGLGVVLRVPVLYGEAESPQESAVNILMDSLWKAQEKEAKVKMDHWALRYPTNTEDVGRVCQGNCLLNSATSLLNHALSQMLLPSICLQETRLLFQRSFNSPRRINTQSTKFARCSVRSWAYH